MSVPGAKHTRDLGTGSNDPTPKPSTAANRFMVCRGFLAFVPTLAILIYCNPVSGYWAAAYAGCIALPLAFIVALGAAIGCIKSATVTGAVVAVGGLVCLCDLRGSGYVAYWLLMAAAAAVGAITGALGGVIGQLMNVFALSFARSAKFVLDKPASTAVFARPTCSTAGF
jgi:hypothetical protein